MEGWFQGEGVGWQGMEKGLIVCMVIVSRAECMIILKCEHVKSLDLPDHKFLALVIIKFLLNLHVHLLFQLLKLFLFLDYFPVILGQHSSLLLYLGTNGSCVGTIA